MSELARSKAERVQRDRERKLLRRYCSHCHERKPQLGGHYLARGHEAFVCGECWPLLIREALALLKRRTTPQSAQREED